MEVYPEEQYMIANIMDKTNVTVKQAFEHSSNVGMAKLVMVTLFQEIRTSLSIT